jgi:hypothetical protein
MCSMLKNNVKISSRYDTHRIAIRNMNYFGLKRKTRRKFVIGYHSLGKKCWVRLGYNMVVYFSLGLCLLA